MKNPREYTLAEIEALLLTLPTEYPNSQQHLNWVRELITYVEWRQRIAQQYEVQKVIEIRARDRETGAVQKSAKSLDRDLLNNCILVQD